MGSSPSGFSAELSRIEGTFFDHDKVELGYLQDQLQTAGENLENETTMANYLRYRDLLGRFAKKVMSIAYVIDTMGSGDQLCHEVVRVINKEADDLYHMVMCGQRYRIMIAGKIANIKGMILKISV
jgi:uncharacterized protein YaaR (DUF327 family)